VSHQQLLSQSMPLAQVFATHLAAKSEYLMAFKKAMQHSLFIEHQEDNVVRAKCPAPAVAGRNAAFHVPRDRSRGAFHDATLVL
jgi:hypothetical protein